MSVDPHYPGASRSELYSADGKIYACMLNQTDIGKNANKFYVLQLIKDSAGGYAVYTRYGRVGQVGRKDIKRMSQVDDAIAAFSRTFYDKTGNTFTGKYDFSPKKGKYCVAQIEQPRVEIKELTSSKLDPRVQHLMHLLGDRQLLSSSLRHLNVDTDKFPLGKLSSSQLDAAQKILAKLSNTINPDEQTELSSQFYTLVPMNTGRDRPPIINTHALQAKYLALIDELRHIEVAASVETNVGENQLDAFYNNIGMQITPLERNDPRFAFLQKYLRNSMGPTHSQYDLEVQEIFSLQKESNMEAFNKYCAERKIESNYLLWHGSGLGNWTSILRNGLRLPGTIPGVPITGAMLGLGTYWAENSTKSWQYVRSESTNGMGCMLLGKIALGKMYQTSEADTTLTEASVNAKGYDSVQGQGKYTSSEIVKTGNTQVPIGKPQLSGINGALLYNEYVVPPAAILPSYLVLIKNKNYGRS